MKIVYCKDSLGNSAGMERVLSTKANYLADRLGYEVHIILASNMPESLFFSFSEKIHFHALNIDFTSQKPWHLFLPNNSHNEYKRKLSALLLQIRPDVTVSMFGPEYDFLYKVKDGSKKVLEFHFSRNYLIHLVNGLSGAKFNWLRKTWVAIVQQRERYYTRKYDHVVLLTEKDKQLWGGKSKFMVIPNPLSFESRQIATLGNKRIIAMGRYIAQKGFDLLIWSFSLLKKDFPDWQLFIYGDGPDKLLLQQLINKLSLQEHVFLVPPVTHVEESLLESSLFVFPSRYEGFGLVLTEAMTCGVPCVAFDCECGPSEIINDKEDGFLVESGNVLELSEKMKLLMEQKEIRKEMGLLAKHNVMRFEVNEIMKRWDDFFNGLILR